MKAATALKLRKGSRYFVRESSSRFHQLITLVHRYVGRHACATANGKLMHLFLIENNECSGTYADDDLQGVEVYSKQREYEVNIAAIYFNETNRVPSKKTMRRLLSQ
jgi:hypothetical protein